MPKGTTLTGRLFPDSQTPVLGFDNEANQTPPLPAPELRTWRVTLENGRTVLVNEATRREALEAAERGELGAWATRIMEE